MSGSFSAANAAATGTGRAEGAGNLVVRADRLSLFRSAALVRARRLSSVELVRSLLERIARHDSRINAFITVDADRALSEARQRDAELARGRWRGCLHGIPYAVKDIIDVAGMRTTCHSRLVPGMPASRDAAVVRRLRASGAVLIGKTALHEFAIGGPSFDLPWPPARNPWNEAHHPGGSSSGSGAAVAAGFVSLALGTDTAGSVRHPASACGVVGMKPTYGAVSTDGCFPLSHSLDHVGPMTRDVRDNAIALSYLVGPRTAARMRCNTGLEYPFAEMERGLEGMRIGVIRDFHAGPDVDPEIVEATESAVRTLGEHGATLSTLRLSPLGVYTECGKTILLAEAFAIHSAALRERPAEYGQRARRRLLAGALISADRLVRAHRIRTHLKAEFAHAMAQLDVAVCISSMHLPCRIDDEGEIDRTYDRQARTPFNAVGVPAMSIPIGLSRSGLPIGLQIVGKRFDEARVYRAALGLERAIAFQARPRFDSLAA